MRRNFPRASPDEPHQMPRPRTRWQRGRRLGPGIRTDRRPQDGERGPASRRPHTRSHRAHVPPGFVSYRTLGKFHLRETGQTCRNAREDEMRSSSDTDLRPVTRSVIQGRDKKLPPPQESGSTGMRERGGRSRTARNPNVRDVSPRYTQDGAQGAASACVSGCSALSPSEQGPRASYFLEAKTSTVKKKKSSSDFLFQQTTYTKASRALTRSQFQDY